MQHFQKNNPPIGKRMGRFGEKPCMYHYQKETVNLKLWHVKLGSLYENRKPIAHIRI